MHHPLQARNRANSRDINGTGESGFDRRGSSANPAMGIALSHAPLASLGNNHSSRHPPSAPFAPTESQGCGGGAVDRWGSQSRVGQRDQPAAHRTNNSNQPSGASLKPGDEEAARKRSRKQ